MEVVGFMACLKTLRIEIIKGGKVPSDQLSMLDALEYLHIGLWYDLEYFPENVLESLTSLQTLSIANCKNLKSLSEGVGHLACLQNLIISECPELVALPSNMSQLTVLRKVSIDSCSTLPYGLQFVPSLRTLDIESCMSTSLPDWLGDMTTLEELSIGFCKKLRSLPSSIQRLTNLSYLSIHCCLI
ncbi:hypothetical protein V8G54_016688 [Vigna mungo]|uniref:Disease resistance R13L4/SHOC-2-like LRR domain-containing protein n=1 Tax=Vigna mungo TaxID=3915 RepID=A0AAQ3NPI7_VIGMU